MTAWTQAVEDEHRLLSQVLAILFAYPQIPEDRLNGRLVGGSQPWPIKGRIGQGKGEKSDFWSAVGGQYKVSLDYVVRLSVESGAKRERGPGGPHANHPHVALGQPVAYGAGNAPFRRAGPQQEGRAAARRLGDAARRRHLGVERRRRARSPSTACRRAATGCWRAPPTAARPTRNWKSPEQASTW